MLVWILERAVDVLLLACFVAVAAAAFISCLTPNLAA